MCPGKCWFFHTRDGNELAPMPPFVAAAGTPAELVTRLQAAFVAAARQEWFAPLAEPLLLEGFAAAAPEAFAVLLERDRAAQAAGYPLPA